jgi:chemotaxis protein histidine kinase CheA
LDYANARKILGIFIEEAKEHLQTLERGILDLGNLVNDTEQINEMFRAAHSIKGGAAILGYSSIQKTAHRLEDAFKILKENPIQVDQKLEYLFLKGYDLLKVNRLLPNYRPILTIFSAKENLTQLWRQPLLSPSASEISSNRCYNCSNRKKPVLPVSNYKN